MVFAKCKDYVNTQVFVMEEVVHDPNGAGG